MDNGPTKIVTIGSEVCTKIFKGLFKAMEQVNKMFQKFVETRFLKKYKKIQTQE